MRIIFGAGKRMFIYEASLQKVRMKLSSEGDEEVADDEGDLHPDPRSVPHASMEISPHAVADGCDDPRRFGFYGSEA